MARQRGGALALTAGAAIAAGLIYQLLFSDPEPPELRSEPRVPSISPTVSAAAPEIFKVGEKEVLAPVLAHRVEPVYPVAARRARMEGVVVIEAVVTNRGEVESPVILKSATPLLDVEALKAVRQWRYRPATFQGRPVRVYLTVTVTFRLN